MKRYFAMVLAVVLLCICTGAMAMGWGRADNPPPTYTVTVTKLDKVATTSGAAYTPAPGKAATVGTVVYFTAKFLDAEGNPVQGTINLTDMDVLYLDGDVVAAIVTGAYPAVRAVYKYTTPLAELTYDGKPVTISGDTVTIGSLTFTRRNGVAVEVSKIPSPFRPYVHPHAQRGKNHYIAYIHGRASGLRQVGCAHYHAISTPYRRGLGFDVLPEICHKRSIVHVYLARVDVVQRHTQRVQLAG